MKGENGFQTLSHRRSRADLQDVLCASSPSDGQFEGNGYIHSLPVNVIAFGYKYGIPLEADLVFDVRFLPNPYYVEELKNLTGMDQPVYDFVMDQAETREYMHRLTDFIDFQLPRFLEEGKQSLTVAVGCTGGRHRSVAVARALTDHLVAEGQNARLIRRDAFKVNEQ